MDITLGNRDDSTGCFNFVIGSDGDVSFDDTESHAVMTSIIEQRGSYYVDPEHGSDLHKIRYLTSRTPSQATAVTLQALAQLESAKMIDSSATQVTASRLGNALSVDVRWQSPAGKRSRQFISL